MRSRARRQHQPELPHQSTQKSRWCDSSSVKSQVRAVLRQMSQYRTGERGTASIRALPHLPPITPQCDLRDLATVSALVCHIGVMGRDGGRHNIRHPGLSPGSGAQASGTPLTHAHDGAQRARSYRSSGTSLISLCTPQRRQVHKALLRQAWQRREAPPIAPRTGSARIAASNDGLVRRFTPTASG
jgi:hypothetical protein